MAPQTRSANRTAGVATRASLARSRSSRKVEVPKPPKPSQKRKAASKTKPKPEQKPEQEPEPEPEPARKRARRLDVKHGRQNRKAVNALGLKNMPVEVLIEIARYVHPLDLVMLSRVNKFFRELFMDKRSARIWRSALQNIPGLPPCPEDVCEPQYAAMIFTKRCSVCGRYAPREMNSALLVRLCARCRDQELVDIVRVTDASLVLSSRGLVPGSNYRRTSWCLYNEARAVKVKLNELTEAGDQEALQKWKKERRELVWERKRAAEPLRKWLENREREQERELDRLRTEREAEIQSRLIKLGWEKGDFSCSEDWRYKQWKSMVSNPKPLTEKIWGDILPYLLGHLETNRNQRLEREQYHRLESRRSNLYAWFSQTHSKLPPFARASGVQGDYPSGGPSAADNRSAYNFVKHMVLYQAFPTLSRVQEWPEYKALLDNDVPDEQFLVDFKEKKPLFQELYANWQRSLEDQLIRLLPDNTHPPDFTVSPLNMVVGTGESSRPIDTLPEGVQKLLRADTIFSITPGEEATPHFYPHDFSDLGPLIHNTYYHSKASEIAKALLSALGSPDASYLGLRAQRTNFQCGRCPPAVAACLTWEALIKHYLDSIRLGERVAREPQAQSNEQFVYVCIHDINLENPSRPLVHLGGSPTGGPPWIHSTCIPCRSLGLSASESRYHTQVIVEHLRDVHLIEAPEVVNRYFY